MKVARVRAGVMCCVVLLDAGCSGPGKIGHSIPACTLRQEYAYVLTGYAVSMFAVNACTGTFSATTPASVPTGYASPQDNSEQMVADPKGRFAYVANLVSNASDLATISMYTINPTTGILAPTVPATVPTGYFPQGIAIDPLGRFVYTANSDDSSISMFTINQTTGVLSPTKPTSVSTAISGELISSPGFLTVDPTGKFLYATVSLSNGAAVFMFSIDQTTGILTPLSPATVPANGIPFQVLVTPSGKFAYAVNNLTGSGGADAVSEYTVNPVTGVLTENTSFQVNAGNGPTAIAVDPTSRFAYVVNRLDNTVSMFNIDQTTGELKLNSTATNPTATVDAGVQPFRIDFDPSGQFVYVTNEGSAASTYTVNGDGTLQTVGMNGVSGGGLSTAFAEIAP